MPIPPVEKTATGGATYENSGNQHNCCAAQRIRKSMKSLRAYQEPAHYLNVHHDLAESKYSEAHIFSATRL